MSRMRGANDRPASWALLAAVALLFGGCASTLLALNEPRPTYSSSGPLVGMSTHPPVPRTPENEPAPSESPVAVCDRPEAMPGEASISDASATRPSDEDITRQLRVRLLSDPGLSSAARKIRITTRNHVVTLTGEIADVRERSQIQAHASALRGVARIDNLLHVAR